MLATQNPIEQEGTYPLPEAQVDRFMLKLRSPTPDKEEEQAILERMAGGAEVPEVEKIVTPAGYPAAAGTWSAISIWTRKSRIISSTWYSPPASLRNSG